MNIKVALQSRRERRFKSLILSQEFVRNIFVSEYEDVRLIIFPNLPPDFEFVNMSFDTMRYGIVVIICHESFPPIPYSDEIPVFESGYIFQEQCSPLWVVEHRDSEVNNPCYFQGFSATGLDWTDQSVMAFKFATELDAFRFANYKVELGPQHRVSQIQVILSKQDSNAKAQ